MSQYLFNLTIGPVQGFIAQARKTHDLFAGSSLLSELARDAYHNLEKECAKHSEVKLDLIFPRFGKDESKEQEEPGSNPNRFAVRITGPLSPDQVKKIGTAVKKTTIESYLTLSLDLLSKKVIQADTLDHARNQLADQLKIVWAARPLIPGKYAETFQELESFINGSKNYRPFRQMENGAKKGEEGRKCNMDGERNVAFYRKNLKESSSTQVPKSFNKASFIPTMVDFDDESKIKIWELQPGEGLSAVSFAKRLFNKNPHAFPSTARVCLMHDLHKMSQYDSLKHFEEKIVKADGEFSHSEDQLFYEENINASVFLANKDYREKGKDGRNKDEVRKKAEYKARKAVKDFRENVYKKLLEQIKKEGLKINLKSKYYAIMIFDGDKMGDWLSGEKLTNKNYLFEFHQYLAELLQGFGEKASKILVKPKGQTVYAGGDDFLGFLNLPSLLTSLIELRQAFNREINQQLSKPDLPFQPKDNAQFTFSAGIAIAHYKQPLGLVLDEARAAEKIAKGAGRNAAAISIIRHSGGTTRCVQSFGQIEAGKSMDLLPIKAMHSICQALSTNKFSNKFIHNLIRETQFWKVELSSPMFWVETERLLNRAKDQGTSPEEVKKMLDNLKNLCPDEKGPETLDNFLSTLRICDFINRSTHDHE